MGILNGLDVLLRNNFKAFEGKSIGVLCNQASLTRDATHILDALLPAHQEGKFRITAVFGPQHGIWGHTQDDMIEWKGYQDPRTGLHFTSLYGEHCEPTTSMLEGIELFVVDLVDVGARYYTFIWTMALCMKACEKEGIPLLILDRPNPLGGEAVEGTVLEPKFASFVGLHPLPMRHGMTLGEIALHLNKNFYPKATVDVVKVEGWRRQEMFSETELLWAMPSPNMPTPDTALVYPGMCLLEGTNISEGRGTTRPFEIFGAPFVEGWKLCDRLNESRLPGVKFRPIQFQPTFQKHAGKICSGAFIHVLDQKAFKPVPTALAILIEIKRAHHDKFEWKQPPYEYETEKMPFDILAGNSWLRQAIEHLEPLKRIADRMESECKAFEPVRSGVRLYL